MNIYKLKYVFACVIYGTIGYILHFINLPSEIVVLARGAIGSLFIYIYLKINKINLDIDNIKKNLNYLILSGISLGLNWVFLFASYRVSTVALGSLCNYMAPIILIILSPFVFNEKLSFKKILCVIGAFVGILLVSGVFENGIKVNVLGMAFGFLAALFFVLLIIFNRKLKSVFVYDKVVVQLAVSAFTVLPYAIFNNLNSELVFDTRSVLLVILLGVVHTGLAYCLYFGSINEIPVQSISILGYIEPVCGVITSAILLAEPISTLGIIGSILIIVSACLSEIIE